MQIKKLKFFIPLALIALTFNAHANDLIFKCTFKNSKQVSLYKKSNNIIYSFGKTNSKPDLQLHKKIEEIETDLENLSGRYATNSIKIKNGIYSYKLTTSVDRIADQQDPLTSLTVAKNNNDLTTLQCIKGSEVGSIVSIYN
ncbi:hypothetical protein EH228_06325 [Erwinia endophytica]|uniref:hypothetical protein n=1 Tax=Erwinia endophytica TaxID=1563158 RepID=UPI001265FC4A|nr:hypothetical protein [Erwinia endophytica]KAB8312646.1 hypothetical protein EH228_06325 [Erwinia endophytica]